MAKRRSSKKSRKTGKKKASFAVMGKRAGHKISRHRKLSSAKKAAKRVAKRAGRQVRVHSPSGKTVAVCGPTSCSAP